MKILKLVRLLLHNFGFLCAFFGGYLIAVAIANRFDSFLTIIYSVYYVFVCILGALVVIEDIIYCKPNWIKRIMELEKE